MIDRTVSRIYQDIFNHKQLSSEIQLKTWKSMSNQSHNLFFLYVVCGLTMWFNKELKESKLPKKYLQGHYNWTQLI